MLSLKTLLNPEELTAFEALVAQATETGAQAVRWHSAESCVLVIGLCAGGQLITWFASPAIDETEAAVVQAVVLAGIDQASHTMAGLQSGALNIAADAIKKAMH
jgi:hypothetical protein